MGAQPSAPTLHTYDEQASFPLRTGCWFFGCQAPIEAIHALPVAVNGQKEAEMKTFTDGVGKHWSSEGERREWPDYMQVTPKAGKKTGCTALMLRQGFAYDDQPILSCMGASFIWFVKVQLESSVAAEVHQA